MTERTTLLTTLTETQRALALERFSLLKPALEDGVSQTQLAQMHGLSLRTIQRWTISIEPKDWLGLPNRSGLTRVNGEGFLRRSFS